MDPELQRLQELQGLDSRLAGLERKLEVIPGRLQQIRDAFREARAVVDGLRSQIENARKEIRTKEKELDFQAAQRKKSEAKLYEVKTNKEYSAVLAEIEIFKVEKGRLEEEVLAHMDLSERLGRDLGEAETRLRAQEREAQGRETSALEEQRALEVDLAAVRSERATLERAVPRDLLVQYARLLKGRGGLAVAVVGASGICSGCRVTLTPQRFQEVRQSSQVLTCESCGRILFYQP